jgi:hypothetical protein
MIHRHRKNKRGMLANLIGAFVMVFVGFTLYGTISQVVDNSLNCINGTTNITLPIQQPIGQTDSFGGGGSGSFGGYDGQVHKSWGSRINVISAGNMTLGCMGEDASPYGRVLLQLIPTFFLIAVIFAAFMMFYSSFHSICWGLGDDI